MQLLNGCSGFLGLEGYVKEGYSSIRTIKKELIELDFSSLLEESKGHSSTYLPAEIARSTNVLAQNLGTWPRGFG